MKIKTQNERSEFLEQKVAEVLRLFRGFFFAVFSWKYVFGRQKVGKLNSWQIIKESFFRFPN